MLNSDQLARALKLVPEKIERKWSEAEQKEEGGEKETFVFMSVC